MKTFFNEAYEIIKLPTFITICVAYLLGLLYGSSYISYMIFHTESLLQVVFGALIFIFLVALSGSIIKYFMEKRNE